jgi:uncharacterized membrane protein YkvA (DUF1232 family)
MRLAALRSFLKDPQVALWRKGLLVGAVLYALWPLDVIPDALPVIGWLDDVGLLSLAAAAVWADVKRHTELLQAKG